MNPKIVHYSMTGYGEAQAQDEQGKVWYVALKTLNSKYLDLQLTLPSSLFAQEMVIRKLLTQKLQRGKVHLTIHLEQTAQAATQNIEKDIKLLYPHMQKLAQELQASTDVITLLYSSILPYYSFFTSEKADAPTATILALVEESIHQCLQVREKEGTIIAKQLSAILEKLIDLQSKMAAQLPERQARLRAKSTEKLAAAGSMLNSEIASQTIAQQLEKLDIEEERVRLESHLQYFAHLLTKEPQQSIGKKLTFLAQEINRELNTLAAKAQDAHLQHLVVTMKELLNQAQEQLQNIL